MSDSMVTARMPQAKKDAGNAVLAALGTNASSAINNLYDFVIQNRALPFEQNNVPCASSAKRIKEALSFVDSIPRVAPSEFDNLDMHELKRRKLIDKGYATERDFS